MTSINNNENNRTFFAFLRQNDAWETEADTNHDGVVGSLELKQYLADNHFDYSSLEGWDGENSKKSTNDLFNKFWNSINITSSSTKISGTKIKQSAGLDVNEQNAMLYKIKADTKVEDFVAELKIPSFIKDETGCKKEIFNKLMELVEKNILNKNNIKNLNPDDLSAVDALLENNAQSIKNAVVTQVYASECIKENMEKVAKEYNYKYEDDSTLKNMISNLAKKITAETSEEEIQGAIEDLVQGYLATAGLGDGTIPEAGDDEGLTAASVWYNPDDGSALNDLQKAVIETNLKKQKETILKEYGDDYNNYKSLFDKAFDDFIADTLKNAKFGDFEATAEFGKAEFEATEIFNNLEKTVKVKNLLRGYEKVSGSEDSMIAKALKDAGLPQSLIDRVINTENRGAFKILDTIENDLIKRVLNGEFGQDIENLSIDEILKDAASKFQKNIMSFYSNGLGKQSLSELKDIYEVMDKYAEGLEDSEQQLAEQRKAAILFCDAVASKNDKFKELVTLAFGDDYKTELGKLLPSEITKLMEDLIARLDKLGDTSTFVGKLTDSDWGNLGDITINVNKTDSTMSVKSNFTIKVKEKDADGKEVEKEYTITSDRIKYESSNKDLIDIAEDGSVTVKAGANAGTYTATVKILVDGVVVGEKTVTVTVEDKIALGTVNAQCDGVNISDIMKGHVTHNKELTGFQGKTDAFNAAKNTMSALIISIRDALKAEGYTPSKVDKAATELWNYYSALMNTLNDTINAASTSNMNCTRTFTFNYLRSDGSSASDTTTFLNNTYSDESDVRGRTSGATGSGICVNVSYQGSDTFQWYVNVKQVLEKFQEFYNM